MFARDSRKRNTPARLREEILYLVNYEDDENLRVLHEDDIKHIFEDDEAEEFEIGDIVNAMWPPNGQYYDAKILQKGADKTELMKERIRLEKAMKSKQKDQTCEDRDANKQTKRKHDGEGQNKGKTKAKKTMTAVQQKKSKEQEERRQKKEEDQQKRKQLQETRKAQAAARWATASNSQVNSDTVDNENNSSTSSCENMLPSNIAGYEDTSTSPTKRSGNDSPFSSANKSRSELRAPLHPTNNGFDSPLLLTNTVHSPLREIRMNRPRTSTPSHSPSTSRSNTPSHSPSTSRSNTSSHPPSSSRNNTPSHSISTSRTSTPSHSPSTSRSNTPSHSPSTLRTSTPSHPPSSSRNNTPSHLISTSRNNTPLQSMNRSNSSTPSSTRSTPHALTNGNSTSTTRSSSCDPAASKRGLHYQNAIDIAEDSSDDNDDLGDTNDSIHDGLSAPEINECCREKGLEITALRKRLEKLHRRLNIALKAKSSGEVMKNRPGPGVIDPSLAAEFEMTELMQGSGVFWYLHQRAYCSAFKSWSCFLNAAIDIFFTKEILALSCAMGNEKKGKNGRPALNPLITRAIIGKICSKSAKESPTPSAIVHKINMKCVEARRPQRPRGEKNPTDAE